MKNVTFEEARTKFEKVFDLAAHGELVVIEHNHLRVALRSFPAQEIESAPPGYFANDYDVSEAAELNALASHVPKAPLP